MRYVPLYDRLIVRILKPNDRTKSGLFIPETHHDNTPYLKAEIVAVGQGRITTTGAVVPLSVAVGEIVVFFRSQSSGEQLVVPSDVPNEELMLIREPNIAFKLEGLDKVTSIVSPHDGQNLVLQ